MKTNTKNKYIKIRISEKEILIQYAASKNLNLSDYVRQSIMCEDPVSKKEIPGLVKTWTMLNTLCCEIEKSDDMHLKDRMKKILNTWGK